MAGLKALASRGPAVLVTAACVPFLSSLTELELVAQLPPAEEQQFWSAMIRHGINLKVVDVFPFTPSVVDYLCAYSGLQKLVLRWPTSQAGRNEINRKSVADHFFTQVLPRHRDTLMDWFSDHDELAGPGMEFWSISHRGLRALSKCKRLERMQLAYAIPLGLDEASPSPLTLVRCNRQ